MKKIFYIATIALFGLASCSKEVLNPVPSNAVSDTQIFSSVASAETALNGGIMYIGYYLTNTLGTILSEVMGEDALMTSGNYGIDTYNWNLYSYTYSQVAEETSPGGSVIPTTSGYMTTRASTRRTTLSPM